MGERAALITGGSGGIGYAIAERLGQSGYSLTISGRREEKLTSAVERLAGEGFDVEGVVADLSKAEEAERLVASHRDRWSRMDCLVNNAGIGIGQPISEITDKFLELQIAVNLKAMVILTRESFGMLQEAGG
ncbi:MAG: SDR family NAD(P)-dependent oxidoreductase, partial [Solirubrobacterales bacterium]